ncbi:hypothetical protein MKT69_08955, partial [Leptospira borgpetersenii]
ALLTTSPMMGIETLKDLLLSWKSYIADSHSEIESQNFYINSSYALILPFPPNSKRTRKT